MKKVLILATGGTIASIPSEEGLTPALSADQLIEAIPGLWDICEIEAKSIMSKASSNMQPEDWITIAENVFCELENYDGFVITHGTDTMAYTASALTFMLQDIKKPVVITGSQIPLREKNSDAEKNILDAFIVACENITGVFIVFDGKVI